MTECVCHCSLEVGNVGLLSALTFPHCMDMDDLPFMSLICEMGAVVTPTHWVAVTIKGANVDNVSQSGYSTGSRKHYRYFKHKIS